MLDLYDYRRFKESYIVSLHDALNDLYSQEYPIPDDYLQSVPAKLKEIKNLFIEINSWFRTHSDSIMSPTIQGVADGCGIAVSLIKEKQQELIRYQNTMEKYAEGQGEKMTPREKSFTAIGDYSTCAVVTLVEMRTLINGLAHTLAIIGNAIIYHLRLARKQFKTIERASFNKIFPADALQLDIDDIIQEKPIGAQNHLNE